MGSGKNCPLIILFFSHLATYEHVAVPTQKQALNALVFMYRNVLFDPLDNSIASIRSKRHPHPPTVLTKAEIGRLFFKMDGIHPSSFLCLPYA